MLRTPRPAPASSTSPARRGCSRKKVCRTPGVVSNASRSTCLLYTSQKIRYGILPQLMPNFASTAIYRFDINLRDATVLGLVEMCIRDRNKSHVL